MGALRRNYFPHQFSWLIDNPVRRLLISPEGLAGRIPVADDSCILEVGPGSGYFSVELARRAPRGRLELFDLQPQMLAKARRKLESGGFANVGYSSGDATNGLPFPDADFDLAVLVSVLGEIPDTHACLASLHRVLRPGAIAAFHEHLPDPDFIKIERLRPMVEREGFVFERRWGPWWNYTVTFRRAV